MEIPKYDALYLPLLNALSDQKIHTNQEIGTAIAQALGIPEELQKTVRLSSGQSRFSNRVNWACVYLKKAGLVESVRRGHHRLTAEGLSVWRNPPPVLDNEFLRRYPSFQAFYNPAPSPTVPSSVTSENNETPNDLIEQSIAALNQELSENLLAEIMAKDFSFFEHLVVKLLLKMGYGGSSSDAGVVTKRSNDGGIDGIIREDKLGFDQIYIQAKRWDPRTTISRPEIQKFSGALRDEGASKGLFITTASFSEGARISAEKQHIVLVDGSRLTNLMIEYHIGVSPVATYEINTIDSDFFNEESDG